MKRQFHLSDHQEAWSRLGVLWSELEVVPPTTRIAIPPAGTKTAIIAFQDNPNGEISVYNAAISPEPRGVGGSKIEVEVSSIDSALRKGEFHIQCHPQYLKSHFITAAEFEFVEWDTWIKNHKVTKE